MRKGTTFILKLNFFSLTIFFLKTTSSIEIIKAIIKIGQKISCAIRKIYGNSLSIPSNKMQEKTK